MHRFAGKGLDDFVRAIRTLALAEPKRFGRAVAVTLLVPYVAWLTFGYRYHFVDGVNLLIHEAGHVVFTPLGQTAHMLGGTILQLALPVVFCLHFLRRGDRYAAALLGIWVAESLMYTGRYMGDAVAQQLPLIGGGTHDWHWLLLRADLLRHAEALGFTTHAFASCLAMASVYLAWLNRDWVQPVVGDLGEVSREWETESPSPDSTRTLDAALGGAWPKDREDNEELATAGPPGDAAAPPRRRRRVLV